MKSNNDRGIVEIVSSLLKKGEVQESRPKCKETISSPCKRTGVIERERSEAVRVPTGLLSLTL